MPGRHRQAGSQAGSQAGGRLSWAGEGRLPAVAGEGRLPAVAGWGRLPAVAGEPGAAVVGSHLAASHRHILGEHSGLRWGRGTVYCSRL